MTNNDTMTNEQIIAEGKPVVTYDWFPGCSEGNK